MYSLDRPAKFSWPLIEALADWSALTWHKGDPCTSCLVVILVSALMRKMFVVKYEGLREVWPIRATETGRGNCTGLTGVAQLGPTVADVQVCRSKS